MTCDPYWTTLVATAGGFLLGVSFWDWWMERKTRGTR